MRHLNLLWAILVVFATLASLPTTRAEEPSIHIIPMDPNFDGSAMKTSEDKDVKVHPVPQPYASGSKRESEVPDPRVRGRLFEKCGLSHTTQDWDHLDRDMLYLRAKNLPLVELQKKYPKLPADGLRCLREKP